MSAIKNHMYREAIGGFATPPVMMANGKMFNWMAEQNGEPAPKDMDGNPLRENEAYLWTKEGHSILREEDIP